MKKVFCVFIVILIMVGTIATFAACKPAEVDPTDDNYRVFYQIFVGSFSDSDGDGVGDLRGIINRMDYLNDGNINSGKSLGVQGLWLSPIFTSPTYHKYDVADYYEIDSKFGTKEDLQELLEICHQRNVKVILDLVLNHSSNQNQWFWNFKSARQTHDEDNEFYNFYTCVTYDEKESGITYYPINNSEYYYEGNFSSDMPEFNYDNEKVRQKMVDVAKYWLDLGVDGFRFDAIKYIYYGSTTKSAAFWDWYMEQLRAIKPDIYTVGECWSGDSEVLQYYSATNCFSFDAGQVSGTIAGAAARGQIDVFAKHVEKFQTLAKEKNENAMFVPFIANHDTDRAAGFLPLETLDAEGNSMYPAYMAANIYLLCSGSPFIYYGEEIGMKGTRGSANTDANRRLAMLWGDDDTVKNPLGSSFSSDKQTNGTVQEQLQNKDSLLNYYSRVIALRLKYPEIPRGTYTAVTLQSGCAGFVIEYNESKTMLLHNVSANEIAIDISNLPVGITKVADFIGQGTATIKGSTLTISAQTSVILK